MTIPPAVMRRVQRTLAADGVIAYPTEAVYGLGCLPERYAAVQHLLALKQRPWEKGLILIAADLHQLDAYLEPLTPEIAARVLPTWPGPVTWLLAARPTTPLWLRGTHSTLAVRVTAHPLAATLCRLVGPLVATSANPAGRPPARHPWLVRRYFGTAVDLIRTGHTGERTLPTPIYVGASGQKWRAG